MENQKTKMIDKIKSVDFVITLIVAILALLTAVIGIFGLIDGFDLSSGDKVSWLCVPSIVLGFAIALFAWLVFTQKIKSGIAYWIIHIVWAGAAISLIIVGSLATSYIGSNNGLVWLPICVIVNGSLLVIDKIVYLIRHILRKKHIEPVEQPTI